MGDDPLTYRMTGAERARLPKAPGRPAGKREDSDPPTSSGPAAVTVQVGRSRWTIPAAVISSMLTLAGSVIYTATKPPVQPVDATAEITALKSEIGRYHDDTNQQIDALRRALAERVDSEHNRVSDVALQLREIDRRLTRVERTP